MSSFTYNKQATSTTKHSSRNKVLPFLLASITLVILGLVSDVRADECHLTPVIHVLQYPGCIPKPIPSFACTGKCTSYVQVSGSKLWQTERSCMCCQESGEREATVSLLCPKAAPGEPKLRRVVTRAPVDCMCRPCTAVEESAVMPQEIARFLDDGSFPFKI
ncbi:putative Bursicon alpha [Daphnia magna]|uniref:Putative Bursicon alpha n=1 Tax=Daphnia magna TaxID=35525 RepID=A0A164WQ02_9CRUS|nr:putative Bursicon alpha [Daphnia magna]